MATGWTTWRRGPGCALGGAGGSDRGAVSAPAGAGAAAHGHHHARGQRPLCRRAVRQYRAPA
eukprot:21216-Chlamydomonas_euryale.AAC.11